MKGNIYIQLAVVLRVQNHGRKYFCISNILYLSYCDLANQSHMMCHVTECKQKLFPGEIEYWYAGTSATAYTVHVIFFSHVVINKEMWSRKQMGSSVSDRTFSLSTTQRYDNLQINTLTMTRNALLKCPVQIISKHKTKHISPSHTYQS